MSEIAAQVVVPDTEPDGRIEFQTDNTQPVLGSAEPRRRNLAHREKWAALILLIPAIIGFVLFWIIPTIRGVFYSTTDFNLLSDPNSVGLANFRNMLSDETMWMAFRVTIYFVVLNVVLGTVLSLATAAIMQRLRLRSWVRSVMLLPWLVPNVAIGLIWAWLLDGNLGYLNQVFRRLGLPILTLLNSSQAMPILVGISIWAGLGYGALMFYAGMMQVPTDFYEAGQIDGASETRMFFSITLPLIRPILALMLVLSAIGSFQVFDLVVIGYGGNPIPEVRTIFFFIYQQAFTFFRMGYASAVALLLAAILAVLTVVQMRMLRGNQSELS